MAQWSPDVSHFEGAEKKFEIVVNPELPWRDQRALWERTVQKSEASILSVVRSADLDAYLLSESSLFVANHHATMITCGRTTLANAAEFLIESIGSHNIDLFIYERKNEAFPHLQRTSFEDDAKHIGRLLNGKAWQFGTEHGHHINIFAFERQFKPEPGDQTIEILMHDIPQNISQAFCPCTPQQSTKLTAQLQHILPSFDIDSHAFTPAGFSLNAVRGADYYTFHITPEQHGSYVSFETNVQVDGQFAELVHQIVSLFQPRNFDVLCFDPNASLPNLEPKRSTFQIKDRVRETIAGYQVSYYQCYQPGDGFRVATPLHWL